ncbi:MAG: transglycosylase SLT domain-containing protein [Vicinamibacteria bacterium]|nr:transglycosylase SLT domain-containing protein [Vicinamibacteria bacterium]
MAAQAAKVGINADLAVCIAEHESRFRPDALGDSHLTCPMTGEPQRSRGLFQISDCWHPEVSDEVAFSVSSATEWALARMQRGYAREWSTYGRCKRGRIARADLAGSASPSSAGAE